MGGRIAPSLSRKSPRTSRLIAFLAVLKIATNTSESADLVVKPVATYVNLMGTAAGIVKAEGLGRGASAVVKK
jgi:hypothetical protein